MCTNDKNQANIRDGCTAGAQSENHTCVDVKAVMCAWADWEPVNLSGLSEVIHTKQYRLPEGVKWLFSQSPILPTVKQNW